MRFSIGYPLAHGPEDDAFMTAEFLADFARVAEDSGYHSVNVTEHPIPGNKFLAAGGHHAPDPFVTLAFAAGATTSIGLLTNLTVVPYRNPFLLAKAAATLDRVSNGRLTLGVGTGYLKPEFFALGVDFDERNALFDEALEVLPRAWSGEPFDAEGLHFTAKGVIQRPRPAQNPIPIWIGGNSKLSRRRAARVQGWMPMGIPEEVAKTTRSPHIGSIAQLGDMIAEVKDFAGDRADELDFSMSYSGEGLAQPTKDVERHREAIGQLAAVGVTWVNVGSGPMAPSALLEWVHAFGETYCG